MSRFFKAALSIAAALCWFAGAALCGFLVFRFLAEGAGVSHFGLGIASSSVLLGMIFVVGFSAAALLCVGIGLLLLARH